MGLWGVENGCDELHRADLGGDIHLRNPAEEVNLMAGPGGFYATRTAGPSSTCRRGPGTQWVHELFDKDTAGQSDDWCMYLSFFLSLYISFSRSLSLVSFLF